MTQRRKLPIGIQTFSEIITGGHYYVDKTALVQQLVDQGKYYFLSRPRRFGKSLLVDTLKELFEGNEPLFRGLAIHDQWDWSKQFPVIRVSFGGGVLHDQAALDVSLSQLLDENERRLGIKSAYSDLRARFRDLIYLAYEKTGMRTVVLIDEYDKPILDNISDAPMATQMRERLKDLYSVMKDMDSYVRFVFLTGVSKFSKVSLFSGLNNLVDITLDKKYSNICGYTDNDIDTVFEPELDGLDRERIRRWYNGYNWLGEAVYNPYDALLLFSKREFHPYWFETGTPTFLVKLLAKNNFFSPNFVRLRSNLDLLSAFDVDRILPEAILFQAGYLTIRNAEERLDGQWIYTLGYPNREVEISLNAALLSEYSDDPHKSLEHRLALLDALEVNDFDAMRELFTSLFASIPYQWYVNNPISQYEGYYASVFYSHFAALGLDIILEDSSNRGRVDMTVHFNKQYYLFEFKVVEQIPHGGALEQLKARRYSDKYIADGQPIHLIGVEFSKESKSVVRFEVESMQTPTIIC